MKNRTYNFFIIILLFSLQTFLYAEINYVNKKGMTIETRYNVPTGYKRVSVEKGSFAEFLRNQKLKPYGEKALYYNGKEKPNSGIYDIVLDVEIGKQDLHQCADAIMLLRAEYLYSKKEYNKINFHFTSGFEAKYSKWIEGYRISVKVKALMLRKLILQIHIKILKII